MAKAIHHAGRERCSLNIVLCDDNHDDCEYYARLLESIAQKSGLDIRLTTYENGQSFLFDLEDMEAMPDIVFLDVVMPKLGGMAVARKLSEKNFAGAVVFLSVSREYAFEAFDVRAFNYVLKTDDSDGSRFRRVFLEAVSAVEERKTRYIQINGITERLNIPIDDICYFEVRGRVCVVHFNLSREKTLPGTEQTIEFLSPLGKLENMLLQYGFLRTHRSFLVNCAYVQSYTYTSIVLSNGAEVPLGRAKRASFLEAMDARATVHVTEHDET